MKPHEQQGIDAGQEIDRWGEAKIASGSDPRA
jgi:hypothetical protein